MHVQCVYVNTTHAHAQLLPLAFLCLNIIYTKVEPALILVSTNIKKRLKRAIAAFNQSLHWHWKLYFENDKQQYWINKVEWLFCHLHTADGLHPKHENTVANRKNMHVSMFQRKKKKRHNIKVTLWHLFLIPYRLLKINFLEKMNKVLLFT